jgi:hypothetical protein
MMKQLQVQWVTPLVSAVRYESRAREAITLAANLSGQTPSTNTNSEYCWLPSIMCDGRSIVNLDSEDKDVGDETTEDPEDAVMAPQALLLEDILDGGDNEEEEKHIRVPVVHLQWEVPPVSASNLNFFMPLTSFPSHK